MLGWPTRTGKAVGETPPRLLGEKYPHYSQGAVDFFARALSASSPPSSGALSQDARRELELIATIGRLYCNDTLLPGLKDLLAAVHAFTEGRISRADLDETRDRFALQCRLALGTND